MLIEVHQTTIRKIPTKQQYKQNNINNNNTSKSTGPGIRFGETIDAGVAIFDGVGLAIAVKYPNVKEEMEQAAEEAKDSGEHEEGRDTMREIEGEGERGER